MCVLLSNLLYTECYQVFRLKIAEVERMLRCSVENMMDRHFLEFKHLLDRTMDSGL